jgi:hypothetical protein
LKDCLAKTLNKFHQKTIYFEIIQIPLLNEIYLLKELTDYFFLHICNKKKYIMELKEHQLLMMKK